MLFTLLLVICAIVIIFLLASHAGNKLQDKLWNVNLATTLGDQNIGDIKKVVLKVTLVVIFLSVILFAYGSLPANSIQCFLITMFVLLIGGFFYLAGMYFDLSAIKKVFLTICGTCTLTFFWLTQPSWLTFDLVATTIVLNYLVLIYVSKTKIPALLVVMTAVVIYDVIHVFGTKMMQEVAGKVTALDLPLLLAIPETLSLSSKVIMQLGLGDIVLPGAIIMLALKEGRRLSCKALGVSALIGYFIGWIIACVILAISESPQPATLYLIPATVGIFLWTLRRSGFWKEIFRKQGGQDAVSNA